MTKFSVQAVNKSTNDFYFYMFQQSPELENAGFSATAWLTTAYKVPKNGGIANFSWSINYGLQWSQQSTVSPGVIVGQGAVATPVSTSQGADNYVDFSVADSTPRFTNLKNNGSAGSLFINTDGANPTIPSDTFAFGLSVNDKLAWAIGAQNGLLLTMTPNVKFWMTSGTTVAQNEVLDASVTSSAIGFDFKDGKNNATVNLQSDNTWSEPRYSATPYFSTGSDTQLQESAKAPAYAASYRMPARSLSESAYISGQDESSREMLAQSHYDLSKSLLSLSQIEQNLLMAGSQTLASNEATRRTSEGVKLDAKSTDILGVGGLIVGTLAIRTAVGFGFLYMWSSGIKLKINRGSAGTHIKFSYDGQLGKQAILDAFQAGKEILFRND